MTEATAVAILGYMKTTMKSEAAKLEQELKEIGKRRMQAANQGDRDTFLAWTRRMEETSDRWWAALKA